MDKQERKQKIAEWLEALKSGKYNNPTHVLDTPDTPGRMFITSVYPPSMREAPPSVREWLGLDETDKKE